MQIPIVQIDSFTDIPFSGNPAAVCFLPAPIGEEGMQLIAAEMNLSETAFIEQTGDNVFNLRWFTPTTEVDLCGHATLAAAFMLYDEEIVDRDTVINFETKSGTLTVSHHEEGIIMDFPVIETTDTTHPVFNNSFMDKTVIGAAKLNKNWIIELASYEDIENLIPDFSKIAENSEEGIIVTAIGKAPYDIYSRYFAPNIGIMEDPVTGFAHCALMDYWHKKSQKSSLHAYQASQREGEMRLELNRDRVKIFGKAIKIFEGYMEV
ncbi:PhzF family phenazine biosynthesis protein [Anditalea andensis]|uniref:Phenazine biosynthesis protein PhzF family protein n=1 Tax=Anditalea andensis TaxID=1048983 RepID=A0A074KZ76_9BACT|nr:PhzF family phenazine biosynthesis protein [Anditalea andensis]KEO74214.1 phenazine biosynthesis protein PhzF family protein [Anditalea andensis]